jgi:predicted transposase YbfD/YdcC
VSEAPEATTLHPDLVAKWHYMTERHVTREYRVVSFTEHECRQIDAAIRAGTLPSAAEEEYTRAKLREEAIRMRREVDLQIMREMYGPAFGLPEQKSDDPQEPDDART